MWQAPYICTTYKTREAMYVWRVIEALACGNCCGGIAITVTYYECVTVLLSTFAGIQNARVVYVIVCSLSRCTILPYIMS